MVINCEPIYTIFSNRFVKHNIFKMMGSRNSHSGATTLIFQGHVTWTITWPRVAFLQTTTYFHESKHLFALVKCRTVRSESFSTIFGHLRNFLEIPSYYLSSVCVLEFPYACLLFGASPMYSGVGQLWRWFFCRA